MALSDTFGSTAGDIFSSIVSKGILVFAVILLVGIILGVALYVRWRRKFNIIVEIYSERSIGSLNEVVYTKDAKIIRDIINQNNHKIIFDKGAMIFDKKDGCWYFRILGEKVDLPVPPFNVLQSSNKGNVLKIWQKTHEEFIFLMPDKLCKTHVIKGDGKLYPISQIEQKQVEGDISYWNVKRKEKTKKLFDTESLFMKILPFMPHIIGGVIALFIIYILMDSMPAILNQLQQLIIELRSLKGAVVTTG